MIENLAYKDMRANQGRHHLLDTVDFLRLDATRKLDTDRKSDLGQFFHAVKEREKPNTVLISSSSGPEDDFILMHEVEYTQVVHQEDPEAFIRVVQDDLSEHIVRNMSTFRASLGELGLQVSTGRVVDFRAEDFLRSEPESGTVPLLYPTHVSYGSITWPKLDSKKPNALLDVEQSRTLQVPNEYYVLVKRFSAKEEKKRIVAAVYDPTTMPGSTVGFENHLNYFHQYGRGLTPTLARGLAAYLNATLVDSFSRQFNGHTQVNATDLRNIKYPSRQQLEALAEKIGNPFPTQYELDQLIKEELLDLISSSIKATIPMRKKIVMHAFQSHSWLII